MKKGGWVYIMTNRRRGTLYIGVTANLPERVQQHIRGEGSVFCRRWRLHTLVWAEWFDGIEDAIAREKQMKAWKRAWKIQLVERGNPTWEDISNTIS